MADKNLQQYLMDRGLEVSDKEMDKEILDSTDLLGRIHNVWVNYPDVIRAIINARMEPIKNELIYKVTPYETLIYRQSLSDMSSIVKDFEKYSAEHLRREDAAKEKQAGGDAQNIEDKGSETV